ncbi:MAG: FAD-dependent monooxygenase [Simkaniaceae bacterium]|nr:MAG: FAD-dependent monooxygenase [Simkaniaceae bacterium]
MAKDEILIVGAGPVGLTMASELTRHGVKVRIIDKNTIYAKDSRAVGIHARTLEVFEDMGILPEFLEKGIKVTGINIYSGKNRLIHADYKGFDTPYCFIIDLPQTETERILIHHLEKLGVKIDRNTELNNLELKENSIDVMIKSGERSLVPDEFAYVIGCDGARSTCRSLSQIPFPGSEYPSHWAVFDAKLDWPYDSQEMQLFLHEEGLVALFPLPHERMRVTCELKSEKEGGDPPPVTFELALSILQKRIAPQITMSEPQDISPFMIHNRQVTTYRKGNLFLAGDAAHLHSPAGGQGMNTGIQDAYNLAWKLALVMKGEGEPTILDTYNEERQPIAKSVLKITDKVTKMMTTKTAALSFMRDTVMSLAGSFEKLANQLPKRFSQLYYHYAPNQILVNESKDHPPEHVRAGGRAPDHTVMQAGKEVRLFDLFKGTHHTLLLFAGKKPSKAELNALTSLHHPKIETYYLYRNDSDLNFCPDKKWCLLDREPSAHTHYGISKTTAVLVRPDGYIGYIQSPLNNEEFNHYLKRIFT